MIQSVTSPKFGWILAWIDGVGLHLPASAHLNHLILSYPCQRVGANAHYPAMHFLWALVGSDSGQTPPRVAE